MRKQSKFLSWLCAAALCIAMRPVGAQDTPAYPLAQTTPSGVGSMPLMLNKPVGDPTGVRTQEVNDPAAPLLLRQAIQTTELNKPLKLSSAVRFADDNYPAIQRVHEQMMAAKGNVSVQKLNEYLPDGLFQMQEIMASRNKLTQIIYGSPVFPGNPGPGFPQDNLRPLFFSGAGFNVDWAPLDFGLHKARIELSKSQYSQAQTQVLVTKLDAETAAANAFLDVVEAEAAQAAVAQNVESFEQFATVVGAQVRAQIKPGADQSIADAQLANSRNQLYRAQLNLEMAKADLSNALGVAGVAVTIDDNGLLPTREHANLQTTQPVFEQVPVLQAAHAAIITALAQRKVLDKEYYPVFHWLAGSQLRGSSMTTQGRVNWQDAAGFAPIVPNYQLAMIINWNFLDWFRLKAEKKVQDHRVSEQQYQYKLVLNNLKTEDMKSRARVKVAIQVAENMPVQVDAALNAVRQSEARYKVGLSSVAQVAESNQLLAQSRMQFAVAKVAVWRAMLEVSSVHGDLRPFLAEADRVQQRL